MDISRVRIKLPLKTTWESLKICVPQTIKNSKCKGLKVNKLLVKGQPSHNRHVWSSEEFRALKLQKFKEKFVDHCFILVDLLHQRTFSGVEDQFFYVERVVWRAGNIIFTTRGHYWTSHSTESLDEVLKQYQPQSGLNPQTYVVSTPALFQCL